jgi:hypothetical protein
MTVPLRRLELLACFLPEVRIAFLSPDMVVIVHPMYEPLLWNLRTLDAQPLSYCERVGTTYP